MWHPAGCTCVAPPKIECLWNARSLGNPARWEYVEGLGPAAAGRRWQARAALGVRWAARATARDMGSRLRWVVLAFSPLDSCSSPCFFYWQRFLLPMCAAGGLLFLLVCLRQAVLCFFWSLISRELDVWVCRECISLTVVKWLGGGGVSYLNDHIWQIVVSMLVKLDADERENVLFSYCSSLVTFYIWIGLFLWRFLLFVNPGGLDCCLREIDFQ